MTESTPTDSERIARLERSLAQLAIDVGGASMNNRATRRDDIAALIEETEAAR